MKRDIHPEGRRLYDDGRIGIYEARNPEEHDLVVTVEGDDKPDSYHLLSRGILRDMARSTPEVFRDQLHTLDDVFARTIQERRVTFEELGWAFAKARMVELEAYGDYQASLARGEKPGSDGNWGHVS